MPGGAVAVTRPPSTSANPVLVTTKAYQIRSGDDLRAALTTAPAGSTIEVLTSPIHISGSSLAIAKDVTLVGIGAKGAFQIDAPSGITISSGFTLSLDNVNVNGQVNPVSGGTCNLTNCDVFRAASSGVAAVLVGGTLNVRGAVNIYKTSDSDPNSLHIDDDGMLNNYGTLIVGAASATTTETTSPTPPHSMLVEGGFVNSPGLLSIRGMLAWTGVYDATNAGSHISDMIIDMGTRDRPAISIYGAATTAPLNARISVTDLALRKDLESTYTDHPILSTTEVANAENPGDKVADRDNDGNRIVIGIVTDIGGSATAVSGGYTTSLTNAITGINVSGVDGETHTTG